MEGNMKWIKRALVMLTSFTRTWVFLTTTHPEAKILTEGKNYKNYRTPHGVPSL